jgi:hypothetical protein
MRFQRRWMLVVPAALTMSLWLAACEPQREEVIEDVDIEQADPDTPPPIVEPVRERDEDTADERERRDASEDHDGRDAVDADEGAARD